MTEKITDSEILAMFDEFRILSGEPRNAENIYDLRKIRQRIENKIGRYKTIPYVVVMLSLSSRRLIEKIDEDTFRITKDIPGQLYVPKER